MSAIEGAARESAAPLVTTAETMAATQSTAEDLADLLTSGLVGRQLIGELWRRFDRATRWDVFLGVALAATLMEARITLAEVERDLAQAERGA